MNRPLPPASRTHRRSIARIAISVWITILAAALDAQSQSGPFIGPAAGYSFGVPLTVERERGRVNRYGTDRPGRSYDHAAWLGLSFLAPDLFARDVGVAAELALAQSNGRFVSDPFTLDSLFDPVSLERVLPSHEFEVASSLSVLQLDLRARLGVAGRWSIEPGLWLGYRLSSAFFQVERLTDFEDVTFSDGSRSRIVAAGEYLGASRLRYGPVLTGSARLPMSQGIDLIPHLDLRIDIPALVNDMGVRSARVGGGIALLFDVARYDRMPMAADLDAPARIDTILPPPAREPAIDAAIDLHVDGEADGDSAVVRFEQVYHRQTMPFIPILFFDRDSVDIPARYGRLTKGDTGGSLQSTLARLDPAGVYHHLLDILGHRLRSEPAARIVLTGSSGEGESSGLALARAEGVRRYLSEVWGIDEERMDVRQRVERTGEDRSRVVTVSSGSPAVTAPITTEWLVREPHLPAIGIRKRITAESGVRRWELRITHDGEEVSRYSGGGEPADEPLSFRLSGLAAGSVLSPIVAELFVEDSLGRVVTARDRLRLLLDRSSSEGGLRGGAVREEMVALLAQPHDAAPLFAEGNDEILRELLLSARSGARVTITGGASARSRPHALGAMDVAAKILKIAGSSDLRLSRLHVEEKNDDDGGDLREMPEHEIISTAVRVILDQGRDRNERE